MYTDGIVLLGANYYSLPKNEDPRAWSCAMFWLAYTSNVLGANYKSGGFRYSPRFCLAREVTRLRSKADVNGQGRECRLKF